LTTVSRAAEDRSFSRIALATSMFSTRVVMTSSRDLS
jgi:hypothetical protein